MAGGQIKKNIFNIHINFWGTKNTYDFNEKLEKMDNLRIPIYQHIFAIYIKINK